MSTEVEAHNEQLHHERTSSERSRLSLDIPASEPSSSAPSSGPPSPNPLVDSDAHTPQSTPSETPPPSSSRHASTSSLTSTTLSVKFAPLPELAPRRRRSNTPLGMAARGQLTRKRKLQLTAQQILLQQQLAANPDATPEQLEASRLKQEELAARYAHIQASATALIAREEEAQLELEEEEMERHQLMKANRVIVADEMDDKLLSLGKTVKTFWKKVAHHKDLDLETEDAKAKVRDRRIDKGNETLKHDRGKGKVKRGSIKRKSYVGAPENEESAPATTPLPPLPPLRPILTAITTTNMDSDNTNNTGQEFPTVESPVAEGGGVWEEEIANDFPLNVSQTETIVEGRSMHSQPQAPSSTTLTHTTTTKVEALAVRSPVEESPVRSQTPRRSLLSKPHKSVPLKGKLLLGGAKS